MRRLAYVVLALAAVGVVTAVAAPDPSVPPDMVQLKVRADADKTQIAATERKVDGLKATAVRKKDVIKLNCINDKLIQLKALMRIADNQEFDLNSAIENDQQGAPGILGQLDSSTHEIDNLADQAEACLGEKELSKQESSIEVTKPDIPDNPTTVPPELITVEAPAYASPFM
jgi:hypothetical protein